MSRLKRNLIANLTAKVIVAIAGLAFIPLYIRFLGIEEYAVVALLPTLNALSTVLDLGITPAINREIARLSAKPGSEEAMRDLVRTFEVLAWAIAVALGVILAVLLPILIGKWGQTGSFSGERIRTVAYLMGVAVALGWPLSFYNGAVLGLQRQVALSAINSVAAVLRGFGAVIVLWLISPTMEAFLIWQGAVALALPLIVSCLLWHYLPTGARRPRFTLEPIRGLWRLAAGMSGTGIILVVSENLDKLVLSQVLPIDVFGYYMLASLIASKLGIVMEPIMNSLFPRLSQLAAVPNMEALRSTYRSGVQITAVAIFPAVAILVFFGQQIMTLWTMNPEYGTQAAALVSILIVGYGFYALIDITMVLDWALGRTKLVFWPKLVGLAVSIPLFYGLASKFGATGAALVWLIVNAAVYFVVIPLVHSCWQESQARRWYVQSLMPPLLASVAVAGGWYLLHPHNLSIIFEAGFIALISATTYGAAGLSSPVFRRFLRERMQSIFPKFATSLHGPAE